MVLVGYNASSCSSYAIRRAATDTTELAVCVYRSRSLAPAQRVAAWRALDGLEARGLVIHQLRHGRC
jgi:hypothetical protein